MDENLTDNGIDEENNDLKTNEIQEDGMQIDAEMNVELNTERQEEQSAQEALPENEEVGEMQNDGESSDAIGNEAKQELEISIQTKESESDVEEAKSGELGNKEDTNNVQENDEMELNESDDGELDELKTPDAEKSLEIELISQNIGFLCKTSSGCGYAYVKLSCADKKLTEASILSRFVHLRYLDLSDNYLQDVSFLYHLADLISLNCSNNRIAEIPNSELAYLRILNLKKNYIKFLNRMHFPNLQTLVLNENKLVHLKTQSREIALSSSDLPRLITLELRGNQLRSTLGIENLHAVKNVFLAGNRISKLSGLWRLESLVTLHLRDNQIEDLVDFTGQLVSLQYLNLRNNQIASLDEVKRLHVLPALKVLVLFENPVSEVEMYRLEVLVAVRHLVRLDKLKYSDDEREEAEVTYLQRRQEELDKLQQDGLGNVEE